MIPIQDFGTDTEPSQLVDDNKTIPFIITWHTQELMPIWVI